MESHPLQFLLGLLLHSLLTQNALPSSPCLSGHTGSCVKSDACRSHSCPYGSDCVANLSGHNCHCKKGFRLCMKQDSCTNGRPYCKDIDECKKAPQKCGSKENCLNTIGSYCCLTGRSYGNCTDCERSCHIDGTRKSTNSTDQVCISACEIQALYQRVSAVRRQSDQLGNVVQLLAKTESMMMSLVESPLKQPEERQSMEAFEIEIKRQVNTSETLTFSVLGHTVEVNPAILSGAAPGRVLTAGLVVHKDLETFLSNETETKAGHQGARLSSRVITMVIGNKKKSSLTHPLIFTFFHNKTNKDNFNITCVYWNHTMIGSLWSTDGCELVEYNSTHTVCKAHHLSSFAVLMALKDLPNVFELELITYIGLSISLLCLLLAIVTFYVCQPLKDTRCSIHKNLCLSLFMADFIFLVGISQTSSQVLCGIIAAALHYLFLAVFVWMFLEGVQLYLLVEVVFATKVPLSRYIYWIGYGLPAVIVAISAAANHGGYGTQTACWLTTKNYFSCSFFVPAIFICIVNLIILCKTLMKLSHVISDQRKLDKNRIFTLTAIGQLVILGCTWLFGGFFIQNATIPMMYVFTFFNSFQGMFIFIMHCLMQKKVRESYQHGFRKCFMKSFRWAPVSSISSSNQVRRSVQETESTTSGAIR